MSEIASPLGNATGCDHASGGPASAVAVEFGVGGAAVAVGGAPVAFGDASVTFGFGVGEAVAVQATAMTTEAIATASARWCRGLNPAKADERSRVLDLAEMP